MTGSYPEDSKDISSALKCGGSVACHMSSGTFTQVATSKLLGCLTLVTKPLRAPKPSAWPRVQSLKGYEPCESSDPKE